MTEMQSETTPFWRFSLHFYRQAGVSDACVTLQDDCGVDVNLLLFLLWLAANQRLLSGDDVKRIDDAVRGWRNLAVIPIRNLRRKLKDTSTLVAPRTQEAFRTKVKAIELEAERLQQEALYAIAQSGMPGKQAAPREAACGNVAAYEHVMGISFPRKPVDVVLGAFDGIAHGDFAQRVSTH